MFRLQFSSPLLIKKPSSSRLITKPTTIKNKSSSNKLPLNPFEGAVTRKHQNQQQQQQHQVGSDMLSNLLLSSKNRSTIKEDSLLPQLNTRIRSNNPNFSRFCHHRSFIVPQNRNQCRKTDDDNNDVRSSMLLGDTNSKRSGVIEEDKESNKQEETNKNERSEMSSGICNEDENVELLFGLPKADTKMNRSKTATKKSSPTTDHNNNHHQFEAVRKRSSTEKNNAVQQEGSSSLDDDFYLHSSRDQRFRVFDGNPGRKA